MSDWDEILKRRLDVNNDAETFDRLSVDAMVESMRQQQVASRKQVRNSARLEIVQNSRKRWAVMKREHQARVDELRQLTPAPVGYKRGGTLVVQLTDLHFGALIDGHNQIDRYDLKIAAKRLRHYAQFVIDEAMVHEVDRLVIAMTGDMVDSKAGKESYDKITQSEGVQGLCCARGADMIVEFIREITEAIGADGNTLLPVEIYGINGNEARMTKNVMFGPEAAASFDSELYKHLNLVFRDDPSVVCRFDPHELIIEINEHHRILLIHGYTLKFGQPKEMRRVLLERKATFGLCGHIHEPWITGDWARAGSLVGSDGYAANALSLYGAPTQNLLLIRGKNITTTSVGLADPGEIEGYELHDYAGAYGVAEKVIYAQV